jgi:hypothetical protein
VQRKRVPIFFFMRREEVRSAWARLPNTNEFRAEDLFFWPSLSPSQNNTMADAGAGGADRKRTFRKFSYRCVFGFECAW